MSTIDLFDKPSSQSFPPPRAFQDKTHNALRMGFYENHRCQVVCAPTGAGKTYLGLRLIYEAVKRKRKDGTPQRAVFICDRKTLIKQTDKAAQKYGMPLAGIIQADNPRFDLSKPFQIASAQTLEARGVVDDFDVVVVDECHTEYEVITNFIASTKATVIGLSATPFTKGMGKKYSRVINAATMDELVKLGVLVPLRVLSCKTPSMKGAKTKDGEWTPKEAEQRGLTIVGDVVREWLEHASHLKTIIFGPTIVHCEGLVEKFKAAGVEAACFTAKTDDVERRRILEEFEKPDSSIRVLISVEALAKGFDVTDVGCVGDCRPMRKSLSTVVQMWGRGLRAHGLPWMDPEATKKECLLLDFSGNAVRFAEDFADLYFNGISELDAGEKMDAKIRKDEENPVRKCPACGFSPCGKKCIRCGFEKKSTSLIEHQEGRAEEIDILGLRKKGYADNAAELYEMLATYEKNRGGEKARQRTAIRFKEFTGKWPNQVDRALEGTYDTAARLPNSKVKNKIRSLQIAFARSSR